MRINTRNVDGSIEHTPIVSALDLEGEYYYPCLRDHQGDEVFDKVMLRTSPAAHLRRFDSRMQTRIVAGRPHSPRASMMLEHCGH